MQIHGHRTDKATPVTSGSKPPVPIDGDAAGPTSGPVDRVEVRTSTPRDRSPVAMTAVAAAVAAAYPSPDAEVDPLPGLSSLMADAAMTRRARELLSMESGGETLEARYRIFRGLVELEQKLGDLPLDPSRNRLPEPRFEPPVRAVWDYRAALENRAPGQSLAEAAETVRTIHAHVAPHAGWRASHEACLFLMEGCAQGRFPGRDREQATRDFFHAWLTTGSLDRCREVLQTPPDASAPPTVEKKPDEVIIGGVRVPVKHAARVRNMAQRSPSAPGRDHGLA